MFRFRCECTQDKLNYSSLISELEKTLQMGNCLKKELPSIISLLKNSSFVFKI